MLCQRYLGPAGPEDEDRYWMRRALAAAERGLGATSPNPPAGAVLVKEGRMLAQGYHARAGAPHAEVRAFDSLDDPRAAGGATLYATLEPCSTHGRTPPCTGVILESGVRRVVFGSIDPNPDHAGRAVTLLRGAGVDVACGVLREATDALIRIFRHWVGHRRPYIMAKAGISLDGCLTRPPGESRWLTSRGARLDAQRLRILVDGILVGAETIRQDDPQLTLRHPWAPAEKRPLHRYVLTRSGDLPRRARVFIDSLARQTHVIRHARWPDWLDAVAEAEGITSLLLEGGGVTLTEALEARAVDEIHLYLAPLVSASGGRLVRAALGDSIHLHHLRYTVIGDDVKVSASLSYHD